MAKKIKRAKIKPHVALAADVLTANQIASQQLMQRQQASHHHPESWVDLAVPAKKKRKVRRASAKTKKKR